MATRPRTFAGTIQGARRTGLNQPVRRGGGAAPTRPAGVRAQARVPVRGGRGGASRGTGGGG